MCLLVLLFLWAFVRVLIGLASSYSVVVGVNRDSDDDNIHMAYRRVVRRVHPDKGGAVADAKQLHAAKDDWDAARKPIRRRGRPQRQEPPRPPGAAEGPKCLRESGSGGVLATIIPDGPPQGDSYCFWATGVMFTYQGVRDNGQWGRLTVFVACQVAPWKVARWCATLEASASGRLHIHMYVQFPQAARRQSRSFIFESIRPHVSTSDYCGEGICRKKLQNSIDRGMFYCWADKIGTVKDPVGNPSVAGNYMPAWTNTPMRYPVAGRWLDTLWKRYYLSHAVYEDYIFLARDGVIARKRNLDACREREAAALAAAEIAGRVKRIRSTSTIYEAFPTIQAVEDWQALFRVDALRYPILILHGPSFTGKTEYAKSLFPKHLELKIGTLQHFPDTMRTFQRAEHAAIILDDVRDVTFLAQHQDKLQGKYDALVEFASTPGGQCAYTKDLFCTPIIVTINKQHCEPTAPDHRRLAWQQP